MKRGPFRSAARITARIAEFKAQLWEAQHCTDEQAILTALWPWTAHASPSEVLPR